MCAPLPPLVPPLRLLAPPGSDHLEPCNRPHEQHRTLDGLLVSRQDILHVGVLTVEALVGTLRAGKKRGYVTYDTELLLAGVSDGVDIVLLREDSA